MDEYARQLQTLYASQWLSHAREVMSQPLKATGPRTQRFLRVVASLSRTMDKYSASAGRERALDAIDLGAIYAGVDARESLNTDNKLGYTDMVVLELLDYFKNHFFTWVNKPPCPQCHGEGDNMVATGGRPFPANAPNPDEIGAIETYKCQQCNVDVEFPRIRNPVSLLKTRRGRCGEWVDCFVLILVALLDDPLKVRYVWNQEDHVWCEYYSDHLRRWVHLDPCEAAWDQPLLYWQNWGKAMSYVLGFGTDYCIDLLPKYIDATKQIPQTEIVDSPKEVSDGIKYFAKYKLIDAYLMSGKPQTAITFYYDYLVPYNRELRLVAQAAAAGAEPALALGGADEDGASAAPAGRQLGSAEWTRARGESGPR